jgi:hypothetical protein
MEGRACKGGIASQGWDNEAIALFTILNLLSLL